MSRNSQAAVRLLVLSDLHLELGIGYRVPAGVSFDIAVLAGDIHTPGERAVEWAMREPTLRQHPVVLVPGNHEFYGCEMVAQIQAMRKLAAGSNVRMLHRQSCQISGVRFLGCTLWTDFCVGVVGPEGRHSDQVHAMAEADRFGLDGRRILYADTTDGHRSGRPLCARDTVALHGQDRQWLLDELTSQDHDGPVVVVTHHGPTERSIAARFSASWSTPAFVSDLPAKYFQEPDLWVHGHTHFSFDYVHASCRVIANPRGVVHSAGSFENARFSSGLVVTL